MILQELFCFNAVNIEGKYVVQKSKMRSFLKILAVVLSALLIAAGFFGGYILYRFNCDKSGDTHSYSEIFDQEPVALNIDDSGIFKVLQINDTHMFNGTCENDVKTLDGIKNILSENQYDLIILNGDIVDGFNLRSDYDKFGAISDLADIIEETDTPWTFAPGNNDGEIDGENEDVIAYMMQYDDFICGNEENLDGSMQVYIDLNYNGELAHGIAVMDSGSRTVKAIGTYDYIKKDQAQWLNDETNKRNVKTSVFFHMQTNAFETAYDEGKAYDGYFMSKVYPYDEIKNDTIFDDVTGDNGNISLISCGHQHSNNMCAFYNGRYYQLCHASGYSAGRDDFITPAVTEIDIDVTDNNTQTMYAFNQIELV